MRRATYLERLVRRSAWHQHAACRKFGAAVFFPGRGDALRPAWALCASSVTTPCAVAAAPDPLTEGLLGWDQHPGAPEGQQSRREADLWSLL